MVLCWPEEKAKTTVHCLGHLHYPYLPYDTDLHTSGYAFAKGAGLIWKHQFRRIVAALIVCVHDRLRALDWHKAEGRGVQH